MPRFSRVFPILASLLGAASFVACTDEATAPSVPEFAIVGTEPLTMTSCKPHPGYSSSAWIGPQGGTLRAGKNTFIVPAGALATPVYISMRVTADNFNHVVFRPEGLVFNPIHLPSLIMSYQDCQVARGARPSVAYVNDELGIVEPTPSFVDPYDQTVTGKLSHFSEYVLLSTYAVVY